MIDSQPTNMKLPISSTEKRLRREVMKLQFITGFSLALTFLIMVLWIISEIKQTRFQIEFQPQTQTQTQTQSQTQPIPQPMPQPQPQPQREPDAALFPQDSNELPQWEPAPTPEAPTYLGKTMPDSVWEAITTLTHRQDWPWYAALAWQESTWDPTCYHYDNDNGYAHGLYCLHSYWRKEDVDWMKSQPGGWECPQNNLRALVRCLEAHDKYYKPADWYETASHYNGGSRGNRSYADSVQKHAEALDKIIG